MLNFVKQLKQQVSMEDDELLRFENYKLISGMKVCWSLGLD